MESNKNYLYGAAVQGIQSFIFQTNKLKDIAGASSLVESICKEIFAECLGLTSADELDKDSGTIINAAGNVKYRFSSKDQCEKVVRNFPKLVSIKAPGVTVSQAVVEDIEGQDSIMELERLLRIQRNKAMRNLQIGLMGIKRSTSTGLPATQCEKDKLIDEGTSKKLEACSLDLVCRKAFETPYPPSRLPYDLNKIEGYQSWIAVIHADGNSLGRVVRKIGKDTALFREFSKKLDLSTHEAFLNTVRKLNQTYCFDDGTSKDVIPIRPVVLGGDDLTVICKGELAFDLARIFIREFEVQTQKHLGQMLLENHIFENGEKKDCLTCCAGISFIKSSYPFYYGYDLAEHLCSVAKKDARSLVADDASIPSCLMFHKVQDSFIEDYDGIVKRELIFSNDKSFQFGSYYIDEQKGRWTALKLIDYTKNLQGKEMNPIKNGLREWISLMVEDKFGMAEQKLARLKSVQEKRTKIIDTLTTPVRRGDKDYYPVYDILSLNSILKTE